jgi:Domain of unknown function (DUF6538)
MLETKTAPFTFIKNGIFYFPRRGPDELKHHYTSHRIAYSLHTRSVSLAGSRAHRAAQQLDEYWYHLHLRDIDLPGKHIIRLAAAQSMQVAQVIRHHPHSVRLAV